MPLLDRIPQLGSQAVTASYLFRSILGSKARLRQAPFLEMTVEHCTELCPIEGGMVFATACSYPYLSAFAAPKLRDREIRPMEPWK